MYGPVRTVVWEGSSREACPYPDFLGRYVGEKTFHPDTLAWTENHSRPGNVRELENMVCPRTSALRRSGHRTGRPPMCALGKLLKTHRIGRSRYAQ